MRRYTVEHLIVRAIRIDFRQRRYRRRGRCQAKDFWSNETPPCDPPNLKPAARNEQRVSSTAEWKEIARVFDPCRRQELRQDA